MAGTNRAARFTPHCEAEHFRPSVVDSLRVPVASPKNQQSQPHGDGQGLGRAKVDIVGVTAHGAMSAPGGPGQAFDLAMSREPTAFAHKTKGRNGRQPGKPCRGIGLKGEQAV